QVLINVMLQNPLVLQTPEPKLVVSALGDSSVNLLMRPWCYAADAKPLEVQLLEAAKIALDEAGIEIPYPHQITIERKLN
ncbi:MAG: mechanosensitive ion channel family protein, partial [Chitinophagales bacterium]|nr:mechanosensitive ion channel family protein [Chitinophagales bacterium]